MNKTIKNNTTKKYHYETAESLKQHLMAFLLLYNHQKKLKSLNYQSPYDIILNMYKSKPHLFYDNPYHRILGLNIMVFPATCQVI
mgnify:CR=1 FL=1